MTKWALSTFLLASASHAAIIPSWRINPISPAAIANDPALNGALSMSLMVELSGGSLFNFAGLDLQGVMAVVPHFYNHALGTDVRPSPSLIPTIPALEFDTYVATTNDFQSPAIPGGFTHGTSRVGVNFPFGGASFDVAWGAAPNTGGIGPLEIARITFLPGHGIDLTQRVPIPLQAGELRDNFQTTVLLPPGPFVIPEPYVGSFLICTLIMTRRQRGT